MKCPRCNWSMVPHVDDPLFWACTDCGYAIECDEMVSRHDRTTYYKQNAVIGVVMRAPIAGASEGTR